MVVKSLKISLKFYAFLDSFYTCNPYKIFIKPFNTVRNISLGNNVVFVEIETLNILLLAHCFVFIVLN